MNKPELIQKIRQIEKILSEIKRSLKVDLQPVIRAGIGDKYIIAEVSLPGQHKNPIVFCRTKDLNEDYMFYFRAIHQAIGRIPISMLPEGFKLLTTGTDDWDDEWWDLDTSSDIVNETRNKMLEIFEDYGIKPEFLSIDELSELEDEYDTLYSTEELGRVSPDDQRDMPEARDS